MLPNLLSVQDKTDRFFTFALPILIVTPALTKHQIHHTYGNRYEKSA